MNDLQLGGEIGRGKFGVIVSIVAMPLRNGGVGLDQSWADHGQYVLKTLPEQKFPELDLDTGYDRFQILVMQKQRQQRRTEASLDLVCEAAYLERLNHPNIIGLHAVVGKPGATDYGLVLDRIEFTVEDRIKVWQEHHQLALENQPNMRRQLMPLHFPSISPFSAAGHSVQSPQAALSILLLERLETCRDIASALAYMHQYQVAHRDVKPCNAGFTVADGRLQLFDFGMAKELKENHRIPALAYDAYNATGLTGSRRYMAPEVMANRPYGWSADVYSFAITAWQIVTLETPYEDMGDANSLFTSVVEDKQRPDIRSICKELKLSVNISQYKQLWSLLQPVIRDSWSGNPEHRKSMAAIHEVLQQMCRMLRDEGDRYPTGTENTQHILGLEVLRPIERMWGPLASLCAPFQSTKKIRSRTMSQ